MYKYGSRAHNFFAAGALVKTTTPVQIFWSFLWPAVRIEPETEMPSNYNSLIVPWALLILGCLWAQIGPADPGKGGEGRGGEEIEEEWLLVLCISIAIQCWLTSFPGNPLAPILPSSPSLPLKPGRPWAGKVSRISCDASHLFTDFRGWLSDAETYFGNVHF